MSMARCLSVAALLLSLIPGLARGDFSGAKQADLMSEWISLTRDQPNPIAPGAKINIRNWRQYQNYMPVGMIKLFRQDMLWKMPADVEIDVGPTVSYPLPRSYVEVTEKFGSPAAVVHHANGHNDVANYAGGEPFPNPREPDKGYKLLADLWYVYVPHLIAGGSANPLHVCDQDKFGSISCLKIEYVFRQLAYNTDPGVPREDPWTGDYWYSEWEMVDEPEQSKYEAQLTLFFKDNRRNEELYVFLPSLRRSVRISLAARCSPVFGSDYVQDDNRTNGFNGGIALFEAKFLGHRKILALMGGYKPLGGDFPNNYYMPLGWPKPSWGPWQLRDVDVIDVRRVPSERAGYCEGSRVIYEDSQTHYALWEEVYDADLRLWKIGLAAQREIKDSVLGYVPGSITSDIWDVQNHHMGNASTTDKYGHDLLSNQDVPAEYQEFFRYATPGGLLQILK